ncbi:MAG: hypothetical protein ACR2H1_02305 [Limisphaerales bacterium]
MNLFSNYLTKREQLVICVIIALLLLAQAVKVYRTAQAKPGATRQTKS